VGHAPLSRICPRNAIHPSFLLASTELFLCKETMDYEHRPALKHAAHHCPMHQSLRAEMDKPITFVWN
jgi:hypothetical protein